jgi:7-cyano-7-deazaguanine reductase
MTIDNTEISKVLGQTVSAPAQYDKSILVRELRQNNRTHLNIDSANLPFVGADLWNNWEISALTDKGLPVTGIAKIIYNCNSKYIVESKSAKLYFNSFNMTNFGGSPTEVINNIASTASKDLSEFLETAVQVHIRPANSLCPPWRTDPFHERSVLLDLIVPDIEITNYTESPELLTNLGILTEDTEQKFYSTLLRSNCRVTNQPDAGDVYIYSKCKTLIDPVGLLKYIISFRNENHFHEEVCEAIYVRMKEAYNPDELMVACYYVRRGSLDINPIRASHDHLIPADFVVPASNYPKTPRQ